MAGVFAYGLIGVRGFGPRGSLACEAMSATDRTPIDRDEPCRCGGTAYFPLAGGDKECVNCGRIEKSRWRVAHE